MSETTTRHQPVPRLDPSLTARFERVAARLRSYLLVEGVAWLLGTLFLACTAQLMIDYFSHGLEWSMRLALLLGIVSLGAYVSWRRCIGPLRVAITPAIVAKLLERRHPELASRLISAVRFASGEVGDESTNARSLAARVVAESTKLAGILDVDGLLNSRRAKHSALIILSVVSVGILSGLSMPETIGVWFARNVLLREVEWPQRTRLVVDLPGGELIAARGDDVIIEATADGVQPRSVEFFYETASGRSGREMMITIGSAGSYRYQYVFKNAQEDFRFHLRGGDDRTEWFRARLLERPRIVSTTITIVPPAYARLEPITLAEGQRSAQALLGSQVAVDARANKPISDARLLAASELVAPASVSAERVSVTFFPEQTHTYHFSLLDADGLENRRPVRFSIRVMRDEPPAARLKIPHVGAMITPQAVLPLEVEFSDAYGLAQAEIVYLPSREQAAEGTIPVPGFTPHARTLSASVSWAVAQANMTPGETIALHVRATDFDDVSGPNMTESAPISLRVVTADELLAELARREQESRLDFERLVDAQEQLRAALLTVFDRYGQADAPPEELAAALVPLERRQRNIAGSVNALRQQFEQMLAELRINQLSSHEIEERLGKGIVEPLTVLAKRELVLAADLIRQWSRDAAAESASRVDPQQAEVLLQMRAVLSRMIQWEGYQEAVNMLRDIIRLENELNEEARRKLEQEAGDLFEK